MSNIINIFSLLESYFDFSNPFLLINILYKFTRGYSYMKIDGQFGSVVGRLLLSVFLSAALCYVTSGAAFCDAEDAPYYAPKSKIDLAGKPVQFVFTDRRSEHTRLECADAAKADGTEFDDKDGFDFFKNYVMRMAKESSAKVDAPSDNVIQIELEVLSPRIFGFVFSRVHGLTQFTVKSKSLNKRYCADMKDGDSDSPASLTSFGTRKGAMRMMVSGSTSKTVAAFLNDLSKALVVQPPAGEQQTPEAKGSTTQPAQ
jgi:hypothetical protein